jgi:hypothetical protein
MTNLGPQGEVVIENRELVRPQPAFDSLIITRKQPVEPTAEEIMSWPENIYQERIWSADGIRLKNILYASGKSRTTPPYPGVKE